MAFRVVETRLLHVGEVVVQLAPGNAVETIQVLGDDDVELIVSDFAARHGLTEAEALAQLERDVLKATLQVARAEAAYYRHLSRMSSSPQFHSAPTASATPHVATTKPPAPHPPTQARPAGPDASPRSPRSPGRRKPKLFVDASVEPFATDSTSKHEAEETHHEESKEDTDAELDGFGWASALSSGKGAGTDRKDASLRSESTPSGQGELLGAAAQTASAAERSAGKDSPLGKTLLKRKAERQRQLEKTAHHVDYVLDDQTPLSARDGATNDGPVDNPGVTKLAQLSRKERENYDNYMGWVEAMSSPRRNNDPDTFFA